MKKHFTLCTTLLFCLFWLPGFTQQHSEATAPIFQLLAVGNTPDAEHYLGKLKQRQGKTQSQLADAGAVLLADAQLAWLKGEHRKAEDFLKQYLAHEQLYSSPDSVSYYTARVHAARLYRQLEFYHQAMAQANAVLEKDGGRHQLPADVLLNARAEMAHLQVASGYLNDAASVLPFLIAETAKFAAAKQDEKGNKLSKQAQLQRKQLHGRLLVLQAVLLNRKGHYDAATRQFAATRKTVQKNLGKTDLVFTEFLLEYARHLHEHERHKEAKKTLELALKKTNNRMAGDVYLWQHPVCLDIHQLLARIYFQTGDKGGARDQAALYARLVKKSYEKQPYYTFQAEWLKVSTSKQESKTWPRTLTEWGQKAAQQDMPSSFQAQINWELYQLYLQKDSLRRTEGYLDRYIYHLQNQHGPDAPAAHMGQVELANFYTAYTNKLTEAGAIYDQSLKQVVLPQMAQTHRNYLNLLARHATFHELNGNYPAALANLETTANLVLARTGNQHPEYGEQLLRLAEVQLQLGNYTKAEQQLNEALAILKKAENGNSRAYVRSLQSLARLYVVMSRYEEASSLLNRSGRLAQRLPGATQNLNTMEETAALYLHQERYREAEEMIRNLIALRKARFGNEQHRALIRPHQLMGSLHLATGQYLEAEKSAQKAAAISKAIFTDTSMYYLRSQLLLSRVYTAMGDYGQAEELAQHVADRMGKNLGANHLELAQPLMELAMVRFYRNGGSPDVLNLLNQVIAIYRNGLGPDHPAYARSLQYMATYCLATNQLSAADSLLQITNPIWKEKLGKTNAQSAEVYLLTGDLMRLRKNNKQAIDNYTRAVEMYAEIFSDRHPQYVTALSRLGQMEYIGGRTDKAIQIMDQTTALHLAYIRSCFPALSERQKGKLWELIRPDFEFYNTLAVQQGKKRPELLAKAYDLQLATKAILLNSSQKVRQRIMASPDSVLQAQYFAWQKKREDLVQALTLSPVQQREAGLEPGQLEMEAEELERQLNQRSEEFRKANEHQQHSWRDVREKLNANEYAVELVRYRHFETTFTDSVLYMGLVLSQNSVKAPELVVFPNGKQLEGKYLRNYRNSIKYQLPDDVSYKQYWEPLRRAVPEGAKVYLSADGVFHQINPEALQPAPGKYLLDRQQLVFVSSTRDLLRKSNFSTSNTGTISSAATAVLFGDPEFYASAAPASDAISQLPGSAKEVDAIGRTLLQASYARQIYLQQDATEQALKSTQSPKIFHIATHGYFQPRTESKSSLLLTSGINQGRALDNPLLRSGLLFTHAGDVLRNANGTYQGEGVLTAYEAMNLNLDQTELVVLSACETGMGEVQVGEGVYGLQRAFQVAGARTVIMSLFKVNDEATQQLMSTFYRNWVKTGNKHQAFADAKRELRQTYPEPVFWSGFVMVGVE